MSEMHDTAAATGRRRARRRVLRYGALLFALLAIVTLGAALARFLAAQRDEPPPTTTELRPHWQASLRWVQAHEAELLGQGNAMLWRMLRDTEQLTHEPMLADLLRRYRERWFAREPVSAWVLLIDPAATPASRRVEGFDTLSPYVKLMAYGMSCEPTLADDEMVRGQMNLGWCSGVAARRVLRQPKCVTHQLMGIMLLAQRGCGDTTRLATLTRGLQDRIEDEMSLDIVMRDEYLQRVLMLYWTGVPERVKPVWLRRVLEAQQPDGSWRYDAQWMAPAPDEPGDVVSGFHATAQGMLIVALAMQQAALHGR